MNIHQKKLNNHKLLFKNVIIVVTENAWLAG